MSAISLDVIWVPVEAQTAPASLEHKLSLLDAEERTVYERYRVDFKKIEFLTGRVLLKTLLGQQLGLPPEQIRFVKNDYGKLFLHPDLTDRSPRPLFFNLTHTDRLIACVISPCDGAGIDVERTTRAPLEVMSSVFVPEEIAWVEGQATEQAKREAFFLLWTRKEAVMKAEGMGFSLSPLTFTVPFDFARATEAKYEHFTWRLEPELLCSVTVKREGAEPPECRVRRLELTELFS